MKSRIILASILAVGLFSLLVGAPVAQAVESTEDFPEWVRSVFKFWADEQISDTDLKNALRYLISEGILTISSQGSQEGITTSNGDFFSQVKEQISSTIKVIQDDPILDAVAQSAIAEIPFVGNLLLNLYDNSKGTEEDKTQQILLLLQNYENMNEKRLAQEFEKLQENKDEILKNRDYLEQLVSDTSIILEYSERADEKLDEILKNQEIIFVHLGIEKQIVPGKIVEIPPEALKEIEENDKEIDRLKSEIAQFPYSQEPEEDIDYLLKLATTHFYSQEYQKAIALYDLVLDEVPNDVNALNNKGASIFKLGEYWKAIVWFDKALEIDPEYVGALTNKGASLFKLGEYREAIVSYDKALEINPEYVSALTNKGLALNRLVEYREAIVWYDKTLEIDPEYLNALNNKGIALDNLGEYREAIVWYDKTLEIDPEYVAALSNKGLALHTLGEYREAIVWYDKALEIDPEDVDALNNKGGSIFKLGEYREAIVWFDKALEIDPNYLDALKNKKLAEEKLGL